MTRIFGKLCFFAFLLNLAPLAAWARDTGSFVVQWTDDANNIHFDASPTTFWEAYAKLNPDGPSTAAGSRHYKGKITCPREYAYTLEPARFPDGIYLFAWQSLEGGTFRAPAGWTGTAAAPKAIFRLKRNTDSGIPGWHGKMMFVNVTTSDTTPYARYVNGIDLGGMGSCYFERVKISFLHKGFYSSVTNVALNDLILEQCSLLWLRNNGIDFDAEETGVSGYHNVTIRDCYLYYCGGHGIVLDGVPTQTSAILLDRGQRGWGYDGLNLIENTRILYTVGNGIRIEGCGVTVSKSSILGTRASGIRLADSPTDRGLTGCNKRIEIESSTIVGAGCDIRMPAADCNLAALAGAWTHHYANRSLGANGLEMSYRASEISIHDNSIYWNGDSGIALAETMSASYSGMANWRIQNNVCHSNGQQTTDTAGTAGIRLEVPANNTSCSLVLYDVMITGNRCFNDYGTAASLLGAKKPDPATGSWQRFGFKCNALAGGITQRFYRCTCKDNNWSDGKEYLDPKNPDPGLQLPPQTSGLAERLP